MVGWHHRLNGYEFEQTLGDGEEQGSLAGCSPWDCKELDTTQQLNKISRLDSDLLETWNTIGVGKEDEKDCIHGKENEKEYIIECVLMLSC